MNIIMNMQVEKDENLLSLTVNQIMTIMIIIYFPFTILKTTVKANTAGLLNFDLYSAHFNNDNMEMIGQSDR